MTENSPQPPSESGRVCSCQWTPGIDLPTAECDLHRNDPTLAHREEPVCPCGHGVPSHQDWLYDCRLCGCLGPGLAAARHAE